jgi:hypothetical protein
MWLIRPKKFSHFSFIQEFSKFSNVHKLEFLANSFLKSLMFYYLLIRKKKSSQDRFPTFFADFCNKKLLAADPITSSALDTLQMDQKRDQILKKQRLTGQTNNCCLGLKACFFKIYRKTFCFMIQTQQMLF